MILKAGKEKENNLEENGQGFTFHKLGISLRKHAGLVELTSAWVPSPAVLVSFKWPINCRVW